MIFKHKQKKLSILPIFCIIKHINPLSKEARLSFNSDWDYYYSYEFSWLVFHKVFVSKCKKQLK